MTLRRVVIGLMCIFLLVQGVVFLAPSLADRGRVIILGFDGVDPGILGDMLKNGDLPNLAKLAEKGCFSKLESSNPPQSPTAWSSFATCKTPLNHGVYDFLCRDPKTYMPSPGFGIAKQPELAPDGSLDKRAGYQSNRVGASFWKAGAGQGLRVKSLMVPFAYPVEELGAASKQMCGLDVQDIRGTQSTYFAFSEDFAKEEPVAGGQRMPLKFMDNKAVTNVPGLRVPGKKGVYAQVPLVFVADRGAKMVGIEVQGQKASLAEGQWSEWLEWTFELSPQYSIHAISRFFLMEAGKNVRVYMTCLQHDPRNPMAQISDPDSYSKELADRYGLFKTVGWTNDTKALEKDDMNEDMFLEDASRTMDWIGQLTLDEIERGEFDVLMAGWTETDRVAHMFWRYRDDKHPLYDAAKAAKYGKEIEKTYRKMDEIVGKVMAKLGENDLLMVMSDHGFHSFRTNFSVNTWLVRNGYLNVAGQSDAATAFTDEKYFINMKTGGYNYDWSKSKAYGLGLGMIFLNMQGREGKGIVTQSERTALLEELRTKLMAVTDPATGDKVFSNVYVNVDPKGAAVKDAPDIQLGYADGYQTDKVSAAGAAPMDMFSPNANKWSGEHASSDVAITQGMFFCNKAVKGQPGVMDLGVTTLKYLGAKVPGDFEGKGLL